MQAQQPIDVRAIIFGKLAEMWRNDYVDNPKVKLATPTREKYRSRLDNHILPRWKDTRLGEFRSKDILDWLQHDCSSWHMMIDLRNIMSGIFARVQEWEILDETFANPMTRVKVGRKWSVRPDRILTQEETAEVFARLADPQLLICETCISTGTRISEAVGLQLRHVDLNTGTIKIQQRHCRGDVDEPKTKNSRRILALGTLADRYRGVDHQEENHAAERLDLRAGGGSDQAYVGFRRSEGAEDCGAHGRLRLLGLRFALAAAGQYHLAAGSGSERH